MRASLPKHRFLFHTLPVFIALFAFVAPGNLSASKYSRSDSAQSERDKVPSKSKKEKKDKNRSQRYADEKYGREGFAVGLILPLSGPYAAFGSAILDGFQCGSGTDGKCGESTGIQLVIRDSAADPALAAQHFTELAKNPSIQAIFGPMSAKALEVMAPIMAEHKHLAVIGLAQTKTPPALPHYFQGVPTADMQTAAVARRAVAAGLSRIGIFYPNTPYGHDMADSFAASLSAAGGQVAARATYSPQASDFSPAIRQLKLNVSYFSITNLSGFHAIFIPDAEHRVEAILPYLANHNLRAMPILGTNAWNGNPFPPILEAQFPGSFFPDLFSPNDPHAETQEFVKNFRASFGKTPSPLAAIGYDLIRIGKLALERGGSKDRDEFLKTLRTTGDYQGATTIRGFDESGKLKASFYLFTQQDGAWAPLPK